MKRPTPRANISGSVLLVVLLAACSEVPPDVMTATATGSVAWSSGDSSNNFVLDGPWTPQQIGLGASAGGQLFTPTFSMPNKAGFTRIELGLSGGQVPYVGLNAWGEVRLKLQLPVTGHEPLVNQAEFIKNRSPELITERIRHTGGRRSPFEVTGSFSGTANFDQGSDHATAELEGSFAVQVDCKYPSMRPPNFCGSGDVDNVPQSFASAKNNYSGDYATVQTDCPAEVNQHFIDGMHFEYTVTQHRVGNAAPLACHIVGDDDDDNDPLHQITANRICAASATVTADGCTWTVDVFSTPVRTLFINASAPESCTRAGGRFCNTTVSD